MGIRGGKQEGAGRPKGAKNKKTQEFITTALDDRISPMEVLLQGMWFFHGLSQKQFAKIKGAEDNEYNKDALVTATAHQNLAKEYAKDVAPYIHPKLASTESKVSLNVHETALAELE